MGRDVLNSGLPRSGMAVLPVVVIRSYATLFADVRIAAALSGEQLLVEHSTDFRECCRRKTQTNLANAKGYFEEHLCAGDYYAENGGVQGVWLVQVQPALALKVASRTRHFYHSATTGIRVSASD